LIKRSFALGMCLTALVDPRNTREAKVRRPSVTGPTRLVQVGFGTRMLKTKNAKDL